MQLGTPNPYGECRVMRDTQPSTALLQFAPLSIGGHPSGFQSPRNVQQHSFGGPHVHSDVLVSGTPQGHDDKWKATDGRPYTSTPKLEVEHTHGRPGKGDTQPLGSAEAMLMSHPTLRSSIHVLSMLITVQSLQVDIP